jgi:hypothetical protein
MKPHYFDQEKADGDDIQLKMAVAQGYVPETCLLGGVTVMGVQNMGADPCDGCACPRDRCEGRPDHQVSNEIEKRKMKFRTKRF